MAWFVLLLYLVGFVFWFRNRYRRYRNFNEQRIKRNARTYVPLEVVNMDSTLQMGAFTMALFWPLTLPVRLGLDLLTYRVHTEGEKAEMLEEREKEVQTILAEIEREVIRERKKREEFKKIAKDLNLPGWELL